MYKTLTKPTPNTLREKNSDCCDINIYINISVLCGLQIRLLMVTSLCKLLVKKPDHDKPLCVEQSACLGGPTPCRDMWRYRGIILIEILLVIFIIYCKILCVIGNDKIALSWIYPDLNHQQFSLTHIIKYILYIT